MTLPTVNPHLIQLARQAWTTKRAFVPSDAAAGAPPPPPDAGMPPPPPGGDPGAGAGMPPPPPGAGGMDPAMMGGGGGMPPSPDGGMGGAEIDMKVQSAVQRALQAGGLQGNQTGPAGAKQPKPDINTIATDVFQLKKMFLAYLRRQGIELPPDILDGPNRDPMTGSPAMSPTGGSDVAPGAGQATAAGAIQPISPVQPAVLNAISGGAPQGSMGGGKAASALTPFDLVKEASDMLRLYVICKEAAATRRDAWADLLAGRELDLEPDSPSPGRPIDVAAGEVRSKSAALMAVFGRRRSS